MVDIKKIKITKKSYEFEIRRKFVYTNIYRLINKTFPDKAKEFVANIFKPKSKEGLKTKKIEAVESKKSSGVNLKLLLGAFAVAFVLILLGFTLFFQTLSLEENVKPIVRGNFDSTIMDKGVITAGDRTTSRNIGYVAFDYKSENMDNYSVSLSVYDEYLPSEVFVLDSTRYQASGFDEFFSTLKSNLSEKGINVNKISLEELKNIPIGAIIVVPNGQIPQEFLGPTGLLYSLASKGSVIIYIGNDFDKMLKADSIDPVVETTPQNLKLSDVSFIRSRPSCSGIHLFDSLYEARGAKFIYGCISNIQLKEGHVLFFPQTLDAGWVEDGVSNPSLASEDVAKLIYEVPWAEPAIPTKEYAFNESVNGVKTFFTETFEGNDAYLRLKITSSSNKIEFIDVRTLHLNKKTNGELFIVGGYTISIEQTDSRIRMYANLNDPKDQPKFLYLVFTKDGERIGERIPFSKGSVSTITETTSDIDIGLDSGEYIANIIDDESYVYAQTYLKIVFLDIKHGATDPFRGKYQFNIEKDGKPFVVTRDFNVSVDDGEYGVYSFKDASQVIVDVTSRAPEGLNTGSHKFTFSIGNVKKEVIVQVSAGGCSGIFCRIEFIIVIGLALIIFVIGYYFAKKEKPSYQIDVPDFPPTLRRKVPLKTSEVLDLFEKVNQDYKWNNSPLTLTEFKDSFKRLYYGGSQVQVTDFNAEFILDQLKSRGLVQESLGYYGLTSWGSSGTTIVYLSIFRKIRDICVNNAIPFTQIGESKQYDTKINAVGQDMLVHIYSGDNSPSLIGQILGSQEGGINLVVFKDINSKDAFSKLILSPYKSTLIVKMSVENASIQLLTVEEFERMIKDFRFV